MEKENEFFKSLIEGVENSNHAAEQAMAKAFEVLHPSSDKEIDFGDYVRIEMKRYGVSNEMFLHKVIGRFQSSHAVQVPIDHGLDSGHGTDSQGLGEMQDVLNVVCCGIDETRVFTVAVKDVTLSNHDKSFV